ncbi:hypothetical protein FRB97_006390 [Tulasnella sp. 331]|nr:hypothetical protein FRB97_006390 [Tulasnella sp. 331]
MSATLLADVGIHYSRQQLTIGTAASIFIYISYKGLYLMVINPYFPVLKDLPGPEKLDSYILGNLLKIFKAPGAVVHEE